MKDPQELIPRILGVAVTTIQDRDEEMSRNDGEEEDSSETEIPRKIVEFENFPESLTQVKASDDIH